MSYSYYIYSRDGEKVPVVVRPATESDFDLTDRDAWQTSWNSSYIQNNELEKYAVEVIQTGEIVALGAYYDDQHGISVLISYAESHPKSNPTITTERKNRKYNGIGRVVIAFGVELSLKYGYDGTVYFKAKTTELYDHYKREFGAVDIPAGNYMLILYDIDALNVLNVFIEEED